MGWYTLDRQKNDSLQLQFATSELYSGVTVIESHRHVYTPEEKTTYGLDHDGVSYHAAKINGTEEVRALIILERAGDQTIDYKPYTEHDCPGMATCPRSILEKLTPTKNEFALEWRKNANQFNNELEQFNKEAAAAPGLDSSKVKYQKIDPDQAYSLLRGYEPVVTIKVYGSNAPEGYELEEKRHIYKKGTDYAIKTELFDVDSYGRPEATYFENKLTSHEVMERQKNSMDNAYTQISVNEKMITNERELRTYFDTTGKKAEYNPHARSDPDANPLYNRDGNAFTDALIESFENYKPNNNSKPQTTMEKTGSTTVSGYIGKKDQVRYNYNEETKKSVISLRIGKDDEWTKIKAFDTNAEIIKNGIDNEGITKLTVTGKIKDAKPWVNGKGETVNEKELVVDKLNRHKMAEINGVIAKVEEKTTANNKPYTHLFIKNNVNDKGIEKVEQFNVTIFQENKKGIPSDVKMEVGQPIAIKGELTISRYLDKENKWKESTSINAWNVDRTPTRLKEQIEKLKANAASKEPEQGKTEAPKKDAAAKKAPSAKKGKDTGMQM
jgi:hypothetical protein